jgi:hypothetical protein
MNKAKHKNSHEITIWRAGTFLTETQGEAVKDYFEMTKMSIGSYFEGKGSTRIASGLSFAEERILLPLVLEVTADDREFLKKRNDFYAIMDTQVSYKNGVTLEIGLSESNKLEITNTNLPLKVSDYLRYRQIIEHPSVAKSKEEMVGNSLKKFYIFDSIEVSGKRKSQLEESDNALQAYLELEKEPLKVKQALLLLNVLPAKIPDDAGDAKEMLKDFALKNPKKFLDMKENTEFETNYWLKALVTSGVLKVYSGKYVDAETDKVLANDEKEMIFFFKDEENSDTITVLKARHQEKTKNKIDA